MAASAAVVDVKEAFGGDDLGDAALEPSEGSVRDDEETTSVAMALAAMANLARRCAVMEVDEDGQGAAESALGWPTPHAGGGCEPHLRFGTETHTGSQDIGPCIPWPSNGSTATTSARGGADMPPAIASPSGGEPAPSRAPSPARMLPSPRPRDDAQDDASGNPQAALTLLVKTPSAPSRFDFGAPDATPSAKPRRPAAKQLRFVAQAALVPMRGKRSAGEDAFFISKCGSGLGIADGVGGWSTQGIDAGVYSRRLMANCNERIQSCTGNEAEKSPMRVLRSAFDAMDKVVGSTTACVAVLQDNVMSAVNVGDSGFVIFHFEPTAPQPPPDSGAEENADFVHQDVFGFAMDAEDGCQSGKWRVAARSSEQQHYFNCPFQLGTGTNDVPEHGDVYNVPVRAFDVAVFGTDGVFDNLYDEDIAHVLGSWLDPSVMYDEMKSGHLPELLKSAADGVAAMAVSASRNTQRPTPFSEAARSHGFLHRGGKGDDVTVIIGAIVPDVSGGGGSVLRPPPSLTAVASPPSVRHKQVRSAPPPASEDNGRVPFFIPQC